MSSHDVVEILERQPLLGEQIKVEKATRIAKNDSRIHLSNENKKLCCCQRRRRRKWL